MGHVCRVAISVAVLVVITTVKDVDAKIKNVEFIVDRATNRRVGYVVTKVHPIDRKDDFNETVPIATATVTVTTPANATDNSTKIDRNALGGEDHEHAGEMVYVEEIPDTQAVETSPDAQAVETAHLSFSGDQHPDFSGHGEGEKVITVVKHVPEPYPVERTVHVPIIKKAPYIVEVPEIAPYAVEKQIPYPVKYIIKVPEMIPKPVAVVHKSFYPVHVPVDRYVPHRTYVPEYYPVERKVYYEVQVPQVKPFPLERKIPIPIKIPNFVAQPIPYDKIQYYPVKVEEERFRPVPYEQPFPVPVIQKVPFHYSPTEEVGEEEKIHKNEEKKDEVEQSSEKTEPKEPTTVEPPKVHEEKNE